ncbi:MAG: adenine phosphoribosyltransferase [Chloroflexota bacterium]
MSTPLNLAERIRSVPDFPIPGILFRDITPLLGDPAALKQAVEEMSEPWMGKGIQKVAAMEARGFMFGAAMAIRLGAGFVPVRKAGKLPWKTNQVEYTLEYRADILHIHQDAIQPGESVLVVDDVIATGGTAGAVVQLVEALGGRVAGAQFLIELAGLEGRKLLNGYQVNSVITFEGD